MRIGIIGGSGFVGSHIALHLAEKGYDVTIYDIQKPRFFHKNIKFVRKDIINENIAEIGNNEIIINTAIIQLPMINEKPELGYRVNIMGLQRILEIVRDSRKVKGFILTSSWHVYGEKLEGEITEEYGYHPDRVSERASLYVYSKIGQEVLTRFFSKLAPEKHFIILRLGTVLGEGMPEKTAANIFIKNALKGKPITPYKNTMYRPMFYVDIRDVCRVVERMIDMINHDKNCSISGAYNVFYPKPITILELAKIVRDSVYEITRGKIRPEIRVVEVTSAEEVFSEGDAKKIRGNIEKLQKALGIRIALRHPREIIRLLIMSNLDRPFKE